MKEIIFFVHMTKCAKLSFEAYMYKIHTYYSVIFVHTIVLFIWGTICCTQCNIFLWLEVYILWPCNHLNKIANVFLATERKRWWQIIKSFSHADTIIKKPCKVFFQWTIQTFVTFTVLEYSDAFHPWAFNSISIYI